MNSQELEAKLRTFQDIIDRQERELAEVSAAIGSHDYLDPPDGGSVSLGEQVRRMRAELVSLRPCRSVALNDGTLRGVVDWNELSRRGVLVRINEMLRAEGLAVMRVVETGMSPGAIVLELSDFETWALSHSDLGFTARDLAKHDGDYVNDEVRVLERAWMAGIDSVVVTLPAVCNQVEEDYRRDVRDALDDVGVRYR